MPALTPRSASLFPFFAPKGVAVVGASRDSGKLSYGVVRNLVDPQHGYPGPVYPINPKANEILGLRCYPDIGSVPDPVELAILIIPAALVPRAIEACGLRGVKAAVVISGGFREVGPAGAALEREMVETANRFGMRIMGPNGIGVIDTHTPLNTTFVKGMPPRGHISFLSQSGALCGGIIDWTLGRGIGFSRFLSVGNEADVNETDVIPFLAADEVSRVIALYLEDVKGGPTFVDALREASLLKPVLAIKAGRTASGQAATASHTGALAGVHAAFRAACKQTGVVEVESIQALIDGALALAYQPLPAGDRIAIVTNAGGPAALAADALETAGLRLARSSTETQVTLRGLLHPDAQVGGPVDMLGGAGEHDFRAALDAVLADPACDGVLAVLVPQVLVNPDAVVEAFAAAAAAQQGQAKPLLACLMGEASLAEALRIAHSAEIPAYTFPEDAVEAFGIMRQRARWLQAGTKRIPAEGRDTFRVQPGAERSTQELVRTAKSEGHAALDAAECRFVMEAYGIPTPAESLAASPEDAAASAAKIGFPVVMKLMSPDFLHKSDAGGVLLNIQDTTAARNGFETLIARAYAAHPGAHLHGVMVQKQVTGGREVIVGFKRDPTFGPLIMFGLGGIYVEVLADVSFRLAPLSASDAAQMIDEVRSARLLAGLRGALPADRDALIEAIVRVGRLAAGHPDIAELDINPLIVLPQGQGVTAVDVRAILG